jgi:hypothetical protein
MHWLLTILSRVFTAGKVSGLNSRRLGKKAASKSVDKLIRKPKGRAGRSAAKGGFNIRTAMLLDNDGDRYDRLLVSTSMLAHVIYLIEPQGIVRSLTNMYLKENLTISQQDPAIVIKVIELVSLLHYLCTPLMYTD